MILWASIISLILLLIAVPIYLVFGIGSSLIATCLALGMIVSVSLRPTYAVTGEPFRF